MPKRPSFPAFHRATCDLAEQAHAFLLTCSAGRSHRGKLSTLYRTPRAWAAEVWARLTALDDSTARVEAELDRHSRALALLHPDVVRIGEFEAASAHALTIEFSRYCTCTAASVIISGAKLDAETPWREQGEVALSALPQCAAALAGRGVLPAARDWPLQSVLARLRHEAARLAANAPGESRGGARAGTGRPRAAIESDIERAVRLTLRVPATERRGLGLAHFAREHRVPLAPFTRAMRNAQQRERYARALETPVKPV